MMPMNQNSDSAQPPQAVRDGGPLLALHHIRKQYPSVVAVDDVSLAIQPGEIHAVLGENGAGKSTWMKIIYGAVRPDAGSMEWIGRPVRVSSPGEARELGIAMVFQRMSRQ